ncbi:integrase [Bacillus sp. SA1-12]|uniref:site-specific integrase n=1 Tax=Bacillus sp. SA1-12 TaxID=1455638 RepID=UPI0006267E66|nr:tyrosine-type recombinase/integrase [Bacillus sp. SA1-12]KKI91365.1 integrase [Bacillus sp. SA1-12]
MASFQKYKTKTGEKWLFKTYTGIDPLTGKPKSTTRRGFKTKKEAQRAAAEMEKEIFEGKFIGENSKLFKDFVVEWLEIYKEQRKVKPGTIRIRQHEINNLLPYFSNIKLQDISRHQFQRAINDLKSKFAERTLEGIFATSKMIFSKAKELEYIKKDPTEYAYIPRDKETVEDLENEIIIPNFMEKEELALFLNTARDKGLELDFEMFVTLAYTGIRVGELCALKENDIKVSEGFLLSITKTYYNPGNNIKKYAIVPPKTKSSRRTIDIDELVYACLNRVILRNKEMKLALGKDYHDQGFIFVNNEKTPGYPIYPKLVGNRMKRLLRISGLNTHLTPHSLRHTHTSLLAEADVSLERIMERLGHSDDEITKEIYLHTTKAVRKQDSTRFGNLMKNVVNFDK